MTRNSPWQWRHTKSRSISVMLPMHAKPSGEQRTRRWGCVLNSSTAVTRFWERLSPGSRAGQQRELSARGRRVGPRAQPCWGQTGIAWHASACWVPPCPVTAGSLLDSAVRCFWLSSNTCNHGDLTTRLHLKHSLHPLRICYSKLLATCNGVMYLYTF